MKKKRVRKKKVKVVDSEEENPNRIRSLFKLIFLLYTFILSIELIRRTSVALAPDIKNLLFHSINPLKAVSIGWFTTSLVQSSGAVSTIVATFAGNDLMTMNTAVFILIGATLGTTITALIISLVTIAKQRKDFRHGFEISLCYSIYSALLVAIVFFFEYFFKAFSRLSLLLADRLGEKLSILNVPDLISILTSTVINFILGNNNKVIILLFSFALLIFTLKYIGSSIIGVFGGEKKARGFINKHFESKYKAYFIGVFLTAIVFSSSITIGLLVPLAVSRLISLKKAIPFILGADVGTFTDVFLASVIIGKLPALATAISYLLISLVGTLIFLPNTTFLHKITKYSSKKLIHISRKKAFYFLIAFILIPLLLIIIL